MASSDVIDWSIARRVGRTVAGSGPAVSPRHRARVRDDFREFTRLSDELVREFTGLAPADPIGEPRVLDRNGWIAVNAEGFGAMLQPFVERVGGLARGGFTRSITSRALGVQMGILLGYLSQKVLGQYDLMLSSESAGRVYYVGPNVVEAERRLGIDPHGFRLWIALHEVTHRTQFTGVPWLRERVHALLRQAVDAIELDPARVRRILERGRDLLLAGPRAWRAAEVMDLLLSPEQREVMGQMQALMTVIEGHGNFVMNRVGAQHIRGYAEMHEAVEARRAGTPGAERAFQRVIGLNMKYEQYAAGERFMNEVADRAGPSAVNLIWEREENLPSPEELGDAGAWLSRVLR